MTTIEELTKEVRIFLGKNPGEAGEILRVVAEAMKDFEKSQREKREALANIAITTLLAENLPRKIPYLIDVAFYMMPTAKSIHTQAPCVLDFWRNFLDTVIVEGVDHQWIISTKGIEYETWWVEVVEPSLQGGMSNVNS